MCACIMHVCPMLYVLRNQDSLGHGSSGMGLHFPTYLRQNLMFILCMPD